VNPDGSVGTWISTTSLPLAIYDHESFVFNGYLYVVGGTTQGTPYTSDKIYYAEIQTNGTIGEWLTTADMPIYEASLGCAVYHDTVYVAGGWDPDVGINSDSYYAAFER